MRSRVLETGLNPSRRTTEKIAALLEGAVQSHSRGCARPYGDSALCNALTTLGERESGTVFALSRP